MRTVASASPVDPMAGVWDMSRGRDRSAHGGWWATAAMAAAIVATMGAGIFGALVIQLLRPGPSPHPTALVVPDGTSVRGIAAILFDGGVLGEGVPFALGVRIVADNMPLQAGEFIFPARASALTAIGILASSTPVAHPLTIPEGSTNAQIIALLEAAEGLTGQLSPLLYEGQLLPETYHFTRGDSVDSVIGRMRSAMDETMETLWPQRADNLPFATPEEALILASIVERETGLAAERRMVAGVFINRLRLGMRLQADPTVAYAVSGGQGLERPLTLEDLRIDSPYNTYMYAGLPPGPIANPGRASIEAVLNPAPTSAIYFVADGNGGHAFADTLAEHNANVARYRAILR